MLVSANGSVVSNDAFDIKDEQQPWTLGAYLSKRRVSAETLKLGVAVIEKDNLKVGVQDDYVYKSLSFQTSIFLRHLQKNRNWPKKV